MNKVLCYAALLVSICAPALAATPVVSGGSGTHFDKSRIPQSLRKDYEVFESRCSQCHTLERIAVSYENGVTPIFNRPLDAELIKNLIVTMMRKCSAQKVKGREITKDEAKSILTVMKYILEESVR